MHKSIASLLYFAPLNPRLQVGKFTGYFNVWDTTGMLCKTRKCSVKADTLDILNGWVGVVVGVVVGVYNYNHNEV